MGCFNVTVLDSNSQVVLCTNVIMQSARGAAHTCLSACVNGTNMTFRILKSVHKVIFGQ